MHHIGTDIIEISRIEKAIGRWGDRFLKRVYTVREIKLCRNNAASLAARFAGKEAVLKALNAPIRGIGFRDIEILADSNGRPVVQLLGPAKRQATKIGIINIDISLSHSRENAIAVAIVEL
jgi:holo-[acyl-carrier protein] synthase